MTDTVSLRTGLPFVKTAYPQYEVTPRKALYNRNGLVDYAYVVANIFEVLEKSHLHTQVAIIGAGPAGLMAARQLDLLGLDWLLLEAQVMPRHKSCADVVTSKAIRELDAFFPEAMQSLDAQGALHEIWGTSLNLGEKPSIDIPYRTLETDTERASCYAIERKRLDASLWQSLQDSQPEACLDQARVVSHRHSKGRHQLSLSDGREVNAQVVILASGSSLPGFVQRATTEPKPEATRHTAIGIRSYFKGLCLPQEDRCYLYLDEDWMPGGLYIAPLGHERYNVNMVIRQDRVKKSQLNLNELFQTAISSSDTLREIFKSAKEVGPMQGSPLKLATIKRRVEKQGMILAGDAAGLIDLVSANGIPQALLSGRLAAQCAARLLAGSERSQAIAEYKAELYSAIESDIALGKKLAPFIGVKWVSRLVLSGMGYVAQTGTNTGGGLERALYADKPLEALLKSLNPLQNRSLSD